MTTLINKSVKIQTDRDLPDDVAEFIVSYLDNKFLEAMEDFQQILRNVESFKPLDYSPFGLSLEVTN